MKQDDADAPVLNARASVLKGALARVTFVPFIAVGAVAGSRLIVAHRGVAALGLYSLVATLPTLLPLSDLGLGTATIDPTARYLSDRTSRPDALIRDVVTIVTRIALVGGAIAVIGWYLGLWARVAGTSVGDTNAGVALALGGLAASLPVNIATRVLQGADKNHLGIGIHGCAALLSWVAIGSLATFTRIPAGYLGAIPSFASLVAGVVCSLVAIRVLRIDARSFMPKVLSPRATEIKIGVTARPAAVMGLVLPIAMTSDRVILQHVSGLQAVAVYAACAQIATPLLSVVSSGGTSLWGYFAHVRAGTASIKQTELMRMLRSSIGCGLVLATILALGAVTVAPWILKGQARIPALLVVTFGLLLLVMAMQFPGSMMLTDIWGMRLQARLSTLMAMANVGLSILFCIRLGPAGPVLASDLCLFGFITLPLSWVAWRRLR